MSEATAGVVRLTEDDHGSFEHEGFDAGGGVVGNDGVGAGDQGEGVGADGGEFVVWAEKGLVALPQARVAEGVELEDQRDVDGHGFDDSPDHVALIREVRGVVEELRVVVDLKWQEEVGVGA